MAVPRGQCSSHRHAFQHRCREDTVDPVDYASTLAQTIYWTGAVMCQKGRSSFSLFRAGLM